MSDHGRMAEANPDGLAPPWRDLGAFPLDPERAPAYLVGAGGDVVWRSGLARDGRMDAAAALRLAQLLAREPTARPSLERLRLGGSLMPEAYLCAPVPMADGTRAVLAVAAGAPARTVAAEVPQPSSGMPPAGSGDSNSAAGSGAAVTSEPVATPDVTTPSMIADGVEAPTVAVPAVIKAEVPAQPSPAADAARAIAPRPAWVDRPAAERRPLRFVWQTDTEGRLTQLSSELGTALGVETTALIGETLPAVLARVGAEDADGVLAALDRRDTWSAPPLRWPVPSAGLAVPIEWAGVPIHGADRSVRGLRGYGIARLERAVPWRPAVPPVEAEAAPAPACEEEPAAATLAEPEARAFAATAGADDSHLPVSQGAAAPAPEDDATRGGESPEAPFVATRDAALPARPSVSATPPAPAAVESGGSAAKASALTASDRQTFDAIARALTSRLPGLRDRLAETEREAVATPIAKAADDDPAAQDATATGAAVTAPVAAPNRMSGVAAVIPFDAEVARRSTANAERDVLQAAAPGLLDRVPTGIAVARGDTIVYANRTLLDLLDVAGVDMLNGRGGLPALFADHPPSDHEEGRRVLLRGAEGDPLPVDAALRRVTWAEEPAVMFSFRRAAAGPELTEARARIEALELDLAAARIELREQRSILDTATDGVVVLDAAGRIVALNRSAEALFGYDQREVVGETFTTLLAPESHGTATAYLDSLRGDGVSRVLNDGRQVTGRERKGGRLPLSLAMGRLDEGTDVPRFCAVLRDRSAWEREQAEILEARRAAEAASAQKSEFLAAVSHELRTPMNAILGFSQVMLSENFGPIGNERYRDYVRDIHASGEHVMSLVNDLLDLSKIEAGKLELSFGSVDLNAVIAHCVGLMQPQATQARVLMRQQLAPALPPVVADERSIRQIVLNLLSNATRFTEPGGQVIVSTALSDRGEAIMRVRDTGIGMSAAELEEAMQPFRQVGLARRRGGSGLGLPLTKALVEANRARFHVSSEPKAGTMAEVTFPATRVLAE